VSTSRARIALVFILLFGFFARAATYKSPLLDHHAWRQADTASIARNFVRERFNVLYPQVDQRGAQPYGYVETGLELFAFTVAAISKAGAFHPETGRLLSALLFLGSCWLAFAVVRQRYGTEPAVAAAFLYAFGFPLLLFIERAFMNEALLIFLSLACFRLTQRYLDRPRLLDGALLVVASSLIAAVKLPYLIVWGGIAGLFLERYGAKTLARWETWAIGIVNVLVAAAWYRHAHALAQTTGLSFGMTDKLFDPRLVFSLGFPAQMIWRLVRDILGPVGIVAAVVGAWLAVRERRWFEPLAVAAFLAYVVIVARGNAEHDYYQLALIPIAPVVAGRGVARLADAFARPRFDRTATAASLLAFAAFCTFARLASAHSWFEYSTDDVNLCEYLRTSSAADDRLLFLGDNDPKILFCADRKGWLLASFESTAERARAVQAEGARVAVLRRADVPHEAKAFVADAAQLVYSTPSADVYRFK
jgi:hypothetical protein